MKPFLTRWLFTAIGFAVAVPLSGMRCESPAALIFAALVLGIVNASVRPLLLFLSLPFILFSLGFFFLILNGLLMWLVGSIVPGFAVDGFWQAFFGALIVSLVSGALNLGWRVLGGASSGTSTFVVTTHLSPPPEDTPPSQPKQVRGRVIEE